MEPPFSFWINILLTSLETLVLGLTKKFEWHVRKCAILIPIKPIAELGAMSGPLYYKPHDKMKTQNTNNILKILSNNRRKLFYLSIIFDFNANGEKNFNQWEKSV